jgi:hypothetical protein
MATTTNYGWTTPDDTALVKDGASAIRTLGSSVDTTTKNLNPETTLGDLAYRSSTANVKTRLGLGTAGQVLTVNSGATAPEWATSSSGGMTLISTTTLTGASVTLSSIPQTYNHLQLVVRNFLPATDNVPLAVRLNGDSGANRYRQSITDRSDNNLFNGAALDVTASNDNAVAYGLQIFDVFDYTNATTWKVTHTEGITVNAGTTTNFNSWAGTMTYNQTPAITSLLLLPGSGNFTSGTALLYGVK